MSAAVFFRLLQEEEKGEALEQAIARLADGEPAPGVYVVEEDALRAIPESPFAYWVSERLRRAFRELPPFEGDGRTAKQGLATADDFRFLRLWWEVPAWSIASSREETLAGKRWVAFAKGGEFSPYYADIHLVVNWAHDGREVSQFPGSVIRNPAYYFRPGLTWPLRTHRFCPQVLPAGSIFSVRGYAILAEVTKLPSILGLGSSFIFDYIFKIFLGRFGFPEFIVGMLQRLPTPNLDNELGARLAVLSMQCVEKTRIMEFGSETTHVFQIPSLLSAQGSRLIEKISEANRLFNEYNSQISIIQSEIDKISYEIYGFDKNDSFAINEVASENGEVFSDQLDSDEKPPAGYENSATPAWIYSADVLSYCLGVVWGRWDVRIALKPLLAPKLQAPFDPLPVCSPGMLVGPDGLPATSGRIASESWLRARPNAISLPPAGTVEEPKIPDSAYPIRINWDGILVDDPEHADDIARRVREVLAVIWQERAAASEEEICEALGARTLADYLRRPAGFFAHHLQRYSKSRRQAPIYWPLSTESGSYTLWLYYHRLTSDTLYTAVNRYVSPKIEAAQRELAQIERQLAASGSEATRLRGQREARQRLLDELEAFRDELLRVAALPYRPDLDDGVIINAAPLWRLFRLPKWRKATRETWEKLERGDYDWAHLAYQIWPERVREKCRADRSLAIAHGLAKASEVPAADTGRARGQQRQQVATVLGVEDEELQVPGAGSPRETGEQ